MLVHKTKLERTMRHDGTGKNPTRAQKLDTISWIHTSLDHETAPSFDRNSHSNGTGSRKRTHEHDVTTSKLRSSKLLHELPFHRRRNFVVCQPSFHERLERWKENMGSFHGSDTKGKLIRKRCLPRPRVPFALPSFPVVRSCPKLGRPP